MVRSDSQQPPVPPERSRVAPWVPRLARAMDTQFRVPGTAIRFGLDPIVGIVPVVGDTLTFAIGLAMLNEARRLGLRKRVMARMVGNLALDWVVGLVPGIDLVLDTAVRAHTRNAELLDKHARRRDRAEEKIRSRRAQQAAPAPSAPIPSDPAPPDPVPSDPIRAEPASDAPTGGVSRGRRPGPGHA